MTVDSISINDAEIIKPTELLAAIEKFFRRFCVMPDHAYFPVAVWALATHSIEIFDTFGYLALTSPVKGCGKTRVLEVLNLLCRQPEMCACVTPASLFRMLREMPTVLIDEMDLLEGSKSEVQDEIRKILNVGYKRGAYVPRCDGPDHKVVRFPVFSPKALGAIGSLPRTVMDRSIAIQMQRKPKEQKLERFLLFRVEPQAVPIAQAAGRFAREFVEDIRTAYVYIAESSEIDDMPISDRDIETWLALFAVCAVASPDRLVEIKRCAELMSKSKQAADANDSDRLKLLGDIRNQWPAVQAFWETASLIDSLLGLEESPWSEPMTKLTPVKLARLLKHFEITPSKIRDSATGKAGVRGYHLEPFQKAWRRYL